MGNLRKAIDKFLADHPGRDVKSMWIPAESVGELQDFVGTHGIWIIDVPIEDLQAALAKVSSPDDPMLLYYFTDGIEQTPVYVDTRLKPNQFVFEPE
jgi:hypothetical protein